MYVYIYIYIYIHTHTHTHIERGGGEQRFQNCGARSRTGAVFCVRDTFIFNETWAQVKIYILVNTLLG
jgi:hypothetical protein